MVSGARIVNMESQRHKHCCESRPAATRKQRSASTSASALLFLLLLVLIDASVAASRERQVVKTFQQLRSQSGEQYRSKVLAESAVMMAKTSPMVPMPEAPIVAVTETYNRRTQLQLVAPTNATISESPVSEKRAETMETSTGGVWTSRIKRLIQSQGFQRMVMGNFMNQTSKVWKSTGNELWDGIITDCMRKPSFSCMQKNVYSYLDRTLLSTDVNVTDNFLFIKNQVNYTDEMIRSNEVDGHEDADDPQSRGRSFRADDEDVTPEAGEWIHCNMGGK